MMDAGEVVSDRQLLSDFIRSFMELTAANIDAQTKALERLRALNGDDPDFYEYEAAARCVQVDDEAFYCGTWWRVDASLRCGQTAWHLVFSDGSFVCADADDRFSVRRPRGERAA